MSIQHLAALRHVFRLGVRQASQICRAHETRPTVHLATQIRHTAHNRTKLAIACYSRLSYTTDVGDTITSTSETANITPSTTPDAILEGEPVIKWEGMSLDEIYKEYYRLVDQGIPVTEQDYINVMAFCKRNASARALKFLESLVGDVQRIAPENIALATRGYNMMLQTYFQQNRWSDAMELFNTLLSEGKYCNTVTINTMMSGSIKASSLKNLHQLISILEARKYHFTDENVDRLVRVCNLVGDIESAVIYFNRMKAGLAELGSHAYQGMIYVLKINDRSEDALSLFREMQKANIPATVAIYHMLLDMLHRKGRADEMEEIYKLFQQSGLQSNVSIYLAMGWNLDKAVAELRKQGIPLQTRDFNTLIVRSIQENNVDEAISYFQAMQKEGLQADSVSYSIVMDALLKNHTSDQALDMYNHMIQSGVKPDVHAFNPLLAQRIKDNDRMGCLDALDKLYEHGYTLDARNINHLMTVVLSERRDTQQDCEFVMKLLSKLKEFHKHPNTKTYNLVFKSLARLSLDNQVSAETAKPFKITKKQGSSPASVKVSPANAIELMRKLYQQMWRSPIKFSKPDSATYEVMIGSLIDAAEYRAALRLYEDSKRIKVPLLNSTLVRIQHCLVESGMDMQVIQMFYDHRNKKDLIKEERYYNSVLDTCRKIGLEETAKDVMKVHQSAVTA